MMNPTYWLNGVRRLIEESEASRERSLAFTKLDELEMWLDRCMLSREAYERDQTMHEPEETTEAHLVPVEDMPGHFAAESDADPNEAAAREGGYP